MCGVLKLSRTGYYKWLKRGKSERERRDLALVDQILEIHQETRGVYGAPRIHIELRSQGVKVGKKRVARLMREVGICGVTRRKKWRTTIRDPEARPAPDLVEREFKATKADQLWVADITEIPTRSSRLYLAAVIDVWSRKVVGWSVNCLILFSYLRVSQMLRPLFLSTLRAFTTLAGDIANSVIYHLYSSKRLWQANYKPCVTQSGSTSLYLCSKSSP